jgi:arylsulfatase A-like enzyme
VLWIIFDEMDQHLVFGDRPSTVKLPELDRLRRESLYATNAYPPAPFTYMSMPALISGKLVSRVTPIRADELLINFDGQQGSVAWSEQPSVFSAARQSGFTTGLAGWSHPYCEVIGDNLTQCDEVKEKGAEITLRSSMFLQAEGLISTVPLVQQATLPLIQHVGFLNRIVTKTERQKYTVRYQYVLQSALKAATDRDLDLVLVHSPMPHPPGIYDRSRHEFTLEGRSSYLDNLALVDRTVGELRQAMEAAGTWKNTTLLISADHWWRSEMWARGPFWTKEDAQVAQGRMDHRIPFVLKLAGQSQAVTYDQPFNTVVTHDLLLALLRGEVSTADSATNWLDRHRSIGDSPYNLDELLP